jgi:hypothetical protein
MQLSVALTAVVLSGMAVVIAARRVRVGTRAMAKKPRRSAPMISTGMVEDVLSVVRGTFLLGQKRRI